MKVVFGVTQSLYREDCYVIVIEHGDKRHFFKADRYRDYGGRLHLAWDVSEAKRYKTEAGALKAAGRLAACGTVSSPQRAIVCRYTYEQTARLDAVQ